MRSRPRITTTNLADPTINVVNGRLIVRGWSTGPAAPFAEVVVDGRPRRLSAGPVAPRSTAVGPLWSLRMSDAAVGVEVDETRTLVDWKKPDLPNATNAHPFTVGEGAYSQTIEWRRPTSATRTLIDLGAVFETATVAVNGTTAGVALWPPYRLDITDRFRSGSNTITVKVRNTDANRWDHDLPSGLLGPVTITDQFLVELS